MSFFFCFYLDYFIIIQVKEKNMKIDTNIKFEDYPFKVPTLKRVSNKLESLIKELKECGTARTASLAIKHYHKYMDELATEISLIHVLYSIDTTNKVYKNANDKVNELLPIITDYDMQYTKILANARYRKDLEKIVGKYVFKKYDLALKTFDPKIIPELMEENKLSSKYDEVMGGAKIKFRGETLNLTQLGKYMQDLDRETRKEATIAFDKWIGEHDEELGNIYSRLVELRDTIAKKLGFKNYVELGYLNMGRTDWNAKDVKKYREQIVASVLPVTEKLYKKQIKRIGIKDPQSFDYSLMFASGNPKPAGDSAYLLKSAKSMYEHMSKETGEFFNKMLDLHMMDLEAKPGKAPGGYQTDFPLYKMPFVFANFNGTQGDVNVLTHEMGHAFESYVSNSSVKIPELRQLQMEIAEIHSMSMEFFAWPYMDKFFGKDADKYRYAHLVDAIEFLPYGACVDEFQHWVYENPKASHEDRCKKWKELEGKYTPHKKYDYTPNLAKGRYWLRQSHIFGAPFYYIDYTLSQVVAFQFLAESRKNQPKAWKKYLKLCKCGGKYPFKEMLMENHLRCPFDDGMVEKAINPLLKILKEFDESKF